MNIMWSSMLLLSEANSILNKFMLFDINTCITMQNCSLKVSTRIGVVHD